jgi:acetylornithine deacetylase/succinyl-diaminopimelate desuccinylase-like protein
VARGCAVQPGLWPGQVRGGASHARRSRAPQKVAAVAALLFALPLAAQPDPNDQLALEILRELVSIRSSAPHPENTVRLLEGVAAQLANEGFADDQIHLVRVQKIAALVVRYPGAGVRRPLLGMAHVDVVDAEPNAWKADPFTLAEIDGYYYGRGVIDNKTGAASLIAAFIRMKREGYKPDRDLIMVLSGDEETDMASIAHLTLERRELIDAEMAFNTDVGGVHLDEKGVARMTYVQMSEKLYQTYELEATNPGGHSSRPRPDNAIYDLARALGRIEEYRFPIRINPVVRGMLQATARNASEGMAAVYRAALAEPPDLEAVEKLAKGDPTVNASVRTTCVATMLSAGVAENALPRSARAMVNCRLLPGDTPDRVQESLKAALGDSRVAIRPVGPPRKPSPASPIRDDVMQLLRELTSEHFGPDVSIVPQQSTGATDGRWVRQAGIPVYGFSAISTGAEQSGAHGLDERVRVESFHKAVRFWYELLKRASS